MSKHTELLHELGEFKVNQLLALGVKLGGSRVVDQILAASQLTCQFGKQDEPGILTDDVDAAVVVRLKEAISKCHGVVEEDYPLLAQPDGIVFIDSFVQQLVAFTASQRNAYVVSVDYDLVWSKQIEAANFDWITDYDDNLILLDPSAPYPAEAKRCAKHLFSVPAGQHEQRITLVDPEGELTTEQVLTKMDRMNLQPPVSAETLALSVAYPDLQRENPLVGLGSAWVGSRGYRDFLCLVGSSFVRRLHLAWCGFRWSARDRFPAVRKQPLAT